MFGWLFIDSMDMSLRNPEIVKEKEAQQCQRQSPIFKE